MGIDTKKWGRIGGLIDVDIKRDLNLD